jgi:hypothetical protein
MENIEEICQIFNFKIKAEKNKCIEFPLNGYNVFAMLPTRFGKNLIYTCFPPVKIKILTHLENNTATFAHTHTQQNKKPCAIIFYLNHDACLDKLLFHRGADVITRGRGEGG